MAQRDDNRPGCYQLTIDYPGLFSPDTADIARFRLLPLGGMSLAKAMGLDVALGC